MSRSREDVAFALGYGAVLAVPLALVAVFALALVSLVLRDATLASQARALVPALRVLPPHALAPALVVLAPVASFLLVLAARHARSGGARS